MVSPQYRGVKYTVFNTFHQRISWPTTQLSMAAKSVTICYSLSFKSMQPEEDKSFSAWIPRNPMLTLLRSLKIWSVPKLLPKKPIRALKKQKQNWTFYSILMTPCYWTISRLFSSDQQKLKRVHIHLTEEIIAKGQLRTQTNKCCTVGIKDLETQSLTITADKIHWPEARTSNSTTKHNKLILISTCAN